MSWFFGKKKGQRTVLVADDDVVIRGLLGNLLESQGWRVVEAADGAQAVRVAAAEVPDLILLDVNMPQLTGPECIASIRKDPRLKDVPIIMCSAQDRFDTVEQCLSLGARDYIVKPFEMKAVLAKIDKLLPPPAKS